MGVEITAVEEMRDDLLKMYSASERLKTFESWPNDVGGKCTPEKVCYYIILKINVYSCTLVYFLFQNRYAKLTALPNYMIGSTFKSTAMYYMCIIKAYKRSFQTLHFF